MMNKGNGTFIISLDLELFWGQFDQMNINEYKENVKGVYDIVPKLLELFDKYNIKATWATVGFLLANDSTEAKSLIPKVLPNYENDKISPYSYLNTLNNLNNDKFHFAPELVELISKSRDQDLGSHTFSHYYLIEKGQNLESFESDLEAVKNVFNSKGYDIPRTIVFPRNQVNQSYMHKLIKEGYKAYRGVQSSKFYKPIRKEAEKLSTKIIRLIDSYINLTGHHTYKINYDENIINLKQSMFLRPYNNILFFLEALKIVRIKKAMLHAAKHNKTFHLWWHPHNFGVNQQNNLNNLVLILNYFVELKEKYNFCSENMSSVLRNK